MKTLNGFSENLPVKLKPLFYILICFPFLFVAQADPGNKHKTDSLKLEFSKAGNDTMRVLILKDLLKITSGNEKDLFNKKLKQIVAKNRAALSGEPYKIFFIKQEAFIQFNTATDLYYKNNFTKALEYYMKALKLNNDIHDKKSLFKVCSAIGLCYKNLSVFTKSEEFNLKSLQYANEINDKLLIAQALNNTANLYRTFAHSQTALEYSLKSLKISAESGDQESVGRATRSVANIYYDLSNFTKAAEYEFKALRICEQLGNKSLLAICYQSLGKLYTTQKEYDKALTYSFKGLKLAKELNNKALIGLTYMNIAVSYASLLKPDSAMVNFKRAQIYSGQAGDKPTMAFTLNNMANIQCDLKNYKESAENYEKALKICTETGNNRLLNHTYVCLGRLYLTTLNNVKAESFLKKALKLSKEIEDLDDERKVHELLTDLYTKTNRPGDALEHFKKFITLRDTFFSQNNAKSLLQTEMNYEFNKKKAIADALHKSKLKKQQAVAEEKNKKQNAIVFSVITCILLVAGFLGFVIRSLRITRKQKLLIDLKNAETEKQKQLIEEKQKELLDSIYYARRIQRALITNEKYIHKKLHSLKGKINSTH